MKLTSRALNTCLFAVLTLSAIPTATAEDDFKARKVLLQAARDLTSQGYRMRGEPYVSHLDHQATQRIKIQFSKGSQYAVVLVCDQYCSGADLALSNKDGNDVDIEQKDRAIVTVNPRETATLGIQVTMTECSENPCYYGIGIFAK